MASQWQNATFTWALFSEILAFYKLWLCIFVVLNAELAHFSRKIQKTRNEKSKVQFRYAFTMILKIKCGKSSWMSLSMLWHAITSASSPKFAMLSECADIFPPLKQKSTIITLKIERETKAKHVWLINHPHSDASNYESIFLVVCSLWCVPPRVYAIGDALYRCISSYEIDTYFSDQKTTTTKIDEQKMPFKKSHSTKRGSHTQTNT